MPANEVGPSGIPLPPGAKIGVGRETSQTNEQGIIVQGMVFIATTPAGSQTSVFVPYSDIGDTAKVKALIDARLAAVTAISG